MYYSCLVREIFTHTKMYPFLEKPVKCVQFLRLSFLCWDIFCDKPGGICGLVFCEFNERINQCNHLLREATDTKTQCNPDPCWKINNFLYMYLWKRL